MSVLQIPRRGMMGSAGSGVIIGTVTTNGHSFTIPKNGKTNFVAYIVPTETSRLNAYFAAAMRYDGLSTQNTAYGWKYYRAAGDPLGDNPGLQGGSIGAAFYTETSDSITITCNNLNTLGRIPDNETVVYLLW